MKKLFPLIVIATSWSQPSHAEVRIGKETDVVFASVDEGRQILTARDDFVRRMSPFDRAARMKTDRDVSEADYLEFVGKNVLAWNDAEKRKTTSALQGIQRELKSLSLPFPKKVVLIKTTGNEEGGAAYTRAHAIVLPRAELGSSIEKIQKTICHELFHILSRANPELREKLYAAIGFVKCDEAAFPPELKSRKITNPDAPKNDHCIRLKVEGKERWGIPILFSRAEKYDVKRGGEFFNYLECQFLLVDRRVNSPNTEPARNGRHPKVVPMREASGFFEQVGRNTGYIIHPEEILADNFALLVLREENLPTPQVVKKMREILNSDGRANSDTAAGGKPRG